MRYLGMTKLDDFITLKKDLLFQMGKIQTVFYHNHAYKIIKQVDDVNENCKTEGG